MAGKRHWSLNSIIPIIMTHPLPLAAIPGLRARFPLIVALAMTKRTLLCTLLALVATPALHAVELSFIRGPLENTGIESDASGTVRSQFKGNYIRMYACVRGLTPDTPYQITVDGNIEADFVASSEGSANVQFRLNPTGSQYALDFDPRGKEVVVTDGTSPVLSMIYSGEGEPTELIVDERTSLVRSETLSRGRVEARYLDQKNKTRFILHFLGLDRGVYTLRVGGEDKATIDLSKGRSGQYTFEANKHGMVKHGPPAGKGPKGNGSHGKGPKRSALDFDPRGELVELVAEDETVAFSGTMLAQIDGLPVEDEATVVDLVSTGVDTDATGSAEVVVDEAGETTLTVSVAQLPIGDYEVWIGGAARGTLSVVDDGSGTGATVGTLVFATLTTGTEVELDFPIAGTLEIQQAGTVLLSGSLD